MPPTLRLFAGPDAPWDEPVAPSVTVTLGDLLSACVAPSVEGEPAAGRAWISDFADEPVRVTPDLAELLHVSRTVNAVAPPAPALRAALSAAALSFLAAATLPGCLIVQTAVVNPAPNLPVVAVAPFLNLSAERAADGRRVALAYATELQQVPGFEVVPVGVVEVAMTTARLDPSDPTEAVALAKLIGADAIVVGAVTDYSPYYPPRLGLKTAWYGRDAAQFRPGPPTDPHARRALGEALEAEVPVWKRAARSTADLFRAQGPESCPAPGDLPAPLPYMSYVRLYDGADEDVVAALRDRRALSGDLRSGGWEASLNRSEDFIRFCCRRSIREMLELHGGLAEREYTLRLPQR